MAAQFAFHRGSSYKMFFTKLDEFHATATNGQKYQLLTDQEYQLRFFDFLCKEYHPQHESTKNQIATYDAAKLLSAIKDLAGKYRGPQPKIDINGLPRVLMYGTSAVNAATAKKIKNVTAGPWSATDFATWDDPAQPLPKTETAPHGTTPITVEHDATLDETSVGKRSRGKKRKHEDEVISVPSTSDGECEPSLSPEPNLKRRKQQADVPRSEDILQGKQEAQLDHQAQATITPKDDADPQKDSVAESPESKKRKRQIDNVISVVNTISAEPSPKRRKQETEQNIDWYSIEGVHFIGDVKDKQPLLQKFIPKPWTLNHSEVKEKMSDFYYILQRLSIDYYEIAGTCENESLGHAELKNKERVSPELRSMWASLLGKEAGLPLDKDSDDPLHGSGLRNLEILTGLLAVYITNVVFLGEEDVLKWPHPTKLAERHLKDAMGKVHATIEASLKMGETLEESVKERVNDHIDKLGWICASQTIDSLQSRRSQESGVTGIVRDISTHIMKLLEPHIPFLYIDPPKGKIRPETTPYDEWRRSLEEVLRRALDLSQQLDIKQWPYYLSWFSRGETYDARFMQSSGCSDLSNEKKYGVGCSYGPAISVYHDRTGHRVIHKAMVRVVRLPEDE